MIISYWLIEWAWLLLGDRSLENRGRPTWTALGYLLPAYLCLGGAGGVMAKGNSGVAVASPCLLDVLGEHSIVRQLTGGQWPKKR